MVTAVTGAAGFVGINLVQRLSERDHVIPVDSADRLGRWPHITIANAPSLVLADLRRDASALRDAESIVHLAALGQVDYSMHHPAQVVANNLLSALCVLEVARETGARVVLASSVEVYGGGRSTFDERSELSPRSPYATSKVVVEALAENYRRVYGIEVVLLRFTNLYGPWQAPDRVIPRVLAQQRLGRPSVAAPGRVRDFLHVEDAVSAIAIAERGGLKDSVYNVTTGEGVDIGDLLRRIRGDRDVVPGPPDNGRGAELVASAERFASETGWNPTISLDAGLESLVGWNVEHGQWLTKFDDLVLADWGTPACLSDEKYPLQSIDA